MPGVDRGLWTLDVERCVESEDVHTGVDSKSRYKGALGNGRNRNSARGALYGRYPIPCGPDSHPLCPGED